MLQVIRAIAWISLAVGVSIADSEAIIVPVVMVILAAVLLKMSEVLTRRFDNEENTNGTRS